MDVTFETFDPTPYQRVPLVNLPNTLWLARALIDARPPSQPTLDKLIKRIVGLVGLAEAELTARRREQKLPTYGVPHLLDGADDSLWALTRDLLEGKSAYQHPGLDPFINDPDSPLGQSLLADRRLADRAAVMLQRLFGGQGLAFLRGPAREQAEATGAILRLIEQDQLGPELAELIGPTLLGQLQGLQVQYEAMVLDQLRAEPTGGQNLRELRLQITRAITRYNTAVLALLDEDVPETLPMVVTALQPMVTLRAMSTAPDRTGADPNGLAANVDEGSAVPPADVPPAED